ncbi:MAG: alpha-glucan family phosphorylase [Cryobacterium sp.]|nr:alpha-glucan family phosphorylase [Cryobacterium sp.]
MKAIRKFTVQPVLPDSIATLEPLAINLRWSWHTPTQQLFQDLSPAAWDEYNGDPISILGSLTAQRIAEVSSDQDFVSRANQLKEELDHYLREPRWFQSLTGNVPTSIAYFSPEFGITSAVPQYSGGLGILAGDHLKSASDLGVPLLAVGLFYRSGYFSQSISSDGWQQESYPLIDPDGLPLRLVRSPDGSAAKVTLALSEGRSLVARIWKAKVGRVDLLLLDADVPENVPELRFVTDRLYGGGGEHRLLQELLLGVGGVRALSLYCELSSRQFPQVFHMNEGHASFMGLERISNLIGDGLDFDSAVEIVRSQTVFTTHTPVAAGIDRFDNSLIEKYLNADLLPGLNSVQVLSLGAEDYEGGNSEVFNLALLGLRLSQRANGVSKLHGEVSRKLFWQLWPGFDSAEVPISSITNGVHAPTWIDDEVAKVAIEKFGSAEPRDTKWLSNTISDEEVWVLRNRLRIKLVEYARGRMLSAWKSQHGHALPPRVYSSLLNPEALTIGFARRVPTYKRLTLMLQDEERLKSILTNKERPVQFVIAGKSHPADDDGKRMIQRLIAFAKLPEIRGKMVFLPDFDMATGERLYSGADIWLNNPLRPFEACGTSGMKATLNGSLNLSILDGWWAEYFDGENGWAIPSADTAGDAAERDELEATSLYDLIEHQIVPRFYDRDHQGIPTRWVETIRHSLATLGPELSADRMLRQYTQSCYLPAFESSVDLLANDGKNARELAKWKRRVRENWPKINVVNVESGGIDAIPEVGETLTIRSEIDLGSLSSSEVRVEVVHGRARSEGEVLDPESTQMQPIETTNETAHESKTLKYSTDIQLETAGSFGYTVRVLPSHPGLSSFAELGLVTYAQGSDHA